MSLPVVLRPFAARCLLALVLSALAGVALCADAEPEKDELKLGFIKLTDMAPFAIAYEKGYFEDEGLFVTLEAQANWKVLLDRVITGELDGAHMLAGQPIAATIGYGVQAEVIAPLSLDLNGNAITVSKAVWEAMQPQLEMEGGKPKHPISAAALKPVVEQSLNSGQSFAMGMVFPVSTHNYELRYWLAAGGLHPGFYAPADISGQLQAQVLLSVTPPPQMPATLESGTIKGYCVGEPWNQQAVMRDIGVAVLADVQLFKNNPEKVLGVTRAFADKHPNTTRAMVKALIRAAYWLDEGNGKNRAEAVRILAKPEYVGADAEVIARSMTGTFEYAPGDVRPQPDFNIFFREQAGYPFYSDAIWTLTQMRRWGQIAEPKDDAWYLQTAKQVYRPDIYRAAAQALIDEGLLPASAFDLDSDGYRPVNDSFIDGIAFDARTPNAYLEKFAIGLKGDQRIENGAVVAP
jgi:nitrate/nitrite transport system substrate-binding protein